MDKITLGTKKVSIEFPGVKALSDCDFEISTGTIHAVMGANGAGKSTLMKVLAGSNPGYTGDVLYNGQVVEVRHPVDAKKLGIQIVYQEVDMALIPTLTVEKNITLPLLLDKRRPDPEALDRLIAALGLQDKRKALPEQLSGGQQQRVAIARALALHPDILCFDEPTSALDPELTGEVLKVIRGLAEQHTTMIIVTHEMSFARDVADQVLFMDGGVVVEQGSPEAVFYHPQQERTKQFLDKFNGD